jgi:hypothetical protein
MNEIALTLLAEHVSHKPLPGAAALVAMLRSAFIYLAFVSSVGFTFAVVLGLIH